MGGAVIMVYSGAMLRGAPILLILSLCLPVSARGQEDGGGAKMQRGAELFLRGLRDELGPALGDLQALALRAGPGLQSFMKEMGPALGEIVAQVRDWSRYEPPEMLPNGDIIIRRKPDPAPVEPTEPTEQTDKPVDL